MGGAPEEMELDPRVEMAEGDRLGPFARLADGSLLTVEENATRTSSDGGKTWSRPRKMVRGEGPGLPGPSGVLVRTREGVLVWVYMDLHGFHWEWDSRRHEAAADVQLDVWAIRSLNEGRTWRDRQCIQRGYCGALIDAIETSSGQIVVPVQRLAREPSRHAICPYTSSDQGKTWAPANLLDLGGHGHHGGTMEPTLAELGDGRLWMLLRTNLDQFWSAYSEDDGRSWRVLHPSGIDASSSPGFLLRLASGRLALVWNRLNPSRGPAAARRGGDAELSEVPASWQREELSLALSADDGQTWSDPTVILRVPGGGPSYPYVFEAEPGLLWVSALFGTRLGLRLREGDFI